MEAMEKPYLISLIVSTYNRPDVLGFVLDACARQTDKAFELIVADDGSGSATRDVVAEFIHKNRGRFDVRHVWQEDDGFRLAAIRNKAIMASRGTYLVFIDGDCVPQPDLIERHRSLAQAEVMVTGSRILFGQNFSERVVQSGRDLAMNDAAFWITRRLVGDVNKVMPLFLKVPSNFSWRIKRDFSWKGIKGCNLAAWRRDIDRVGGFDEAFTGWGHEDADFVARLHNAGVIRKLGFCATEVFHLWHPEQPRGSASPNYLRVVQRLRDRVIKAERGLSP